MKTVFGLVVAKVREAVRPPSGIIVKVKPVLLVLALFGASFAIRAQGQSSMPIKNFIFIIQENHSFDNYFGTYPGANGIPPGTALAFYPGGPRTVTPLSRLR
jgi:phospholipase C